MIFFERSPFGNGRRDVGDVSHLRREVVGEQVDVIRKILPGSCHTGDLSLRSELPFDADGACHVGDLLGEDAQRVRHAVDRIRERGDLSLRVDLEPLREVTVGDGRHDAGDAADLRREVRGHEIHVVGEILPRSGDPFHVGLPAELPFRADLLRDARDLGCKRVELVDHRC